VGVPLILPPGKTASGGGVGEVVKAGLGYPVTVVSKSVFLEVKGKCCLSV
jgi:hypothetical protein